MNFSILLFSIPTKGELLLFGKDREKLFADPIARMIRFEGVSKNSAIDELENRSPLPQALEEILIFIRRHTSIGAAIKGIKREEIPQYLPMILREATMNALVHADYANHRSPIQIASLMIDWKSQIQVPYLLA